MQRSTVVFLLVMSLCLSLACSGCKNSAPPREEARLDSIRKPPAEQRTGAAPLPPPTVEDARAVLRRVFGEAVILDGGFRPGFIVGDFNRDGIEDLAAPVRPVSSRLTEINSEAANWIVGDPRMAVLPDPKKKLQRLPAPEPVRIAAGESLLGVVHGVVPGNWRDPEAQQGYLLKIASAADMRAYPIRIEGNVNQAAGKGVGPGKRGDVIRQTLNGVHGYIYWTGGKYAWNHTPARYRRAGVAKGRRGGGAEGETASSSK